MRNTTIIIISFTLVILLVLAGGLSRALISLNLYNDGVCTECGGHYEYVEAVGHRLSTSYIYECDTCGHHIEVCAIME